MALFLDKILLYKEATVDTIPPTPKAFALKAESFGITATQNSETNTELGNGRGASKKGYGSLTIGGDLGMIWNTDNAPILFTHGIGKQLTTDPSASGAWGATAVVAKGDIISHSDGIHDLVCYIAGTTDATEPDLSAESFGTDGRGVRIVDATVTWIIMPKLFTQTGVRGDCLESFGVEVSDSDKCVGSVPNYTRYGGLHISSLPFSIAGADMAVKTSPSLTGMSEEDSILENASGGTYVPLKDEAGFTETEIVSDYYFLEDCVFNLNGVKASVKTTSFDVTINNNVTVDDALNKDKVENIGVVVIEGTISILMDNQMFIDASTHVTQSASFEFTKANGCSMTISLPQFSMDKTNKVYSTDKTTMVDIPLSAFDTTDVKSVTWKTVSPISY